jgi:hypothetical protein
MSEEEFHALVEFLERTPETINRMSADLVGDKLIWKPSAKEFSILEHVCHLRDIEQEGYAVRINRLLSEAEPLLADIDGDRLASERRYNTQNMEPALSAFAVARQDNVHTLKGLSLDQLSRSGMFESVGPITLERLLLMMREHDREHLAALTDLREKVHA